MNFPDIAEEARGDMDEFMFMIDVDEEDFRQYSRDNDPPESWEELKTLHPFCRDEWHKLGKLPKKPSV